MYIAIEAGYNLIYYNKFLL